MTEIRGTGDGPTFDMETQKMNETGIVGVKVRGEIGLEKYFDIILVLLKGLSKSIGGRTFHKHGKSVELQYLDRFVLHLT